MRDFSRRTAKCSINVMNFIGSFLQFAGTDFLKMVCGQRIHERRTEYLGRKIRLKKVRTLLNPLEGSYIFYRSKNKTLKTILEADNYVFHDSSWKNK